MKTLESGSSTVYASGHAAVLDADVVELSLLLPSWQMTALTNAAQDQGLTAGQMVRRLISEFFSRDCSLSAAPESWY